MNLEMIFPDPDLEQAVSAIRNEPIGDEVVEAAAARVWAKLAAAAPAEHAAEHIADCAGFQALIPAYRAGQLPQARVFLLEDHLHQCVACRRAYEGRPAVVAPIPLPSRPRRAAQRFQWAAAAAAVAGIAVWVAVDQYGARTGRAIVQTVNGTLYEVSASGLKPLAAGRELADNVEVRTARDSTAFVRLRDGSVVEMRERSGFSVSGPTSDLTVHLIRGSVIVEAAKHRTGHFYVATADCRVAVTGTIFGVSAGAKGSRVSVVQGEVHVDQNNEDKVLHPGNQFVTSPDLAPEPVREDISWSRNRDRYNALLQKLAEDLKQVRLPDQRYESPLLGHLPASTVFFASIPNLAAYLGQAESVFRRNVAENPELQRWVEENGSRTAAIIEQLRAGSEYLGSEIAIVGLENSEGPVFLAEVRREGFPEFLKKQQIKAASEQHNGLIAFGPVPQAVHRLVESLDSRTASIQGTPFYPRILDAYRQGAGFLLCIDLAHAHHVAPVQTLDGASYLIADDKQNGDHMEARLSIGFNGTRSGIAAWLANPAPMGSLEYVSGEAAIATAFVVAKPSTILDQVSGSVMKHDASNLGDIHRALASALGGEFSLSLDGPIIPVPSWKLVVEVYDPAAAQSALQQAFQLYNADAAQSGKNPIITSQETFEGRTYYTAAVRNAGPLMEAHYTFADGYLIAAPSRALVTKALQLKQSGDSILRSSKFQSLVPRDCYANFSAVLYQNAGATLAPLASLLGGFMQLPGSQSNNLSSLGNLKPNLIAAYGESDRLTFAANGDLLGPNLTKLMSGDLSGMFTTAIPFGGTHQPHPSYR
jgi:ferric-dicitrate binding protein FerR (iron transport regulator)